MRNHRNIPSYTPPHLQGDYTRDIPQSTPQETHRLTLPAYKQLEQMCEAAQVNGTTTEIQAGFKLGIQHVLRLLRDGFVIGT